MIKAMTTATTCREEEAKSLLDLVILRKMALKAIQVVISFAIELTAEGARVI